jgi:hypothetical protein
MLAVSLDGGFLLMKRLLLSITVSLLGLTFGLIGCGGSNGGGTNPPPPVHSLSFHLAETLSAGNLHPKQIVAADFNGDGKPDLAVSLFDTSTVAVFLGKGDGTFQPPVHTTLPIPDWLGILAVGDFNEDGKQDLIVSTIDNGNQENILLLGNGDGTFSQQSPLPNSCGSLTTVVVDLNGDHHMDLVLGCNGGLQVYLGHGDGTFSGPANLPIVSFPGTYFGVAVADFNGDGKLDIAAVDTGSQSTPSGSLDFYAGNGDGSFRAPVATPLPLNTPLFLSYADFHQDGKLDLLVGYANEAILYNGNGDGTFQITSPTVIYSSPVPNPQNAISVLASDFLGNHSFGVVTVDFSSGKLQIALNSALGKVPPDAAIFQLALAAGTAGLASADFNRDGVLDDAVFNYNTGDITIILSSVQ